MQLQLDQRSARRYSRPLNGGISVSGEAFKPENINQDLVVSTAWLGIVSGTPAWMVVGEISHKFGFVKIESQAGLIFSL